MTDNLDLFGADPEVPPRSNLYRLPLDGRGTCRQESLLSYLHRLARAHNVAPMDLVVRHVVPVCSIRGAQYGFSFSNIRVRTADGYAKYARELMQALTSLTCADHLSDATFLHWESLLDPHGGGLLHPLRRWCPSCLADATDSGDVVSYDLLWSSYVVDHCAVHLTPLVSNCPTCKAKQPFLTQSASYGRCHTCRGLLGRRGGLWDGGKITARARFNLDAMAAMVSLGPEAAKLARPSSLARVVQGLADAYFDGYLCRFEKAIGSLKMLSPWLTRAAKPRMASLLEFCFRIGVMPTELLAPGFEPRLHGGTFHRGTNPRPRVTVGITDARRAKLNRYVEELIASERVVTIKEAVAESGTSLGYFKYHLPDTYKLLATHVSLRRVSRTRASADARCDQAVQIARRLFAESAHIPRRRLASALAQAGLSILNPEVRKAALLELRRLREAMANQR